MGQYEKPELTCYEELDKITAGQAPSSVTT